MDLGERNCKRDQQRLFVAVCFARIFNHADEPGGADSARMSYQSGHLHGFAHHWLAQFARPDHDPYIG